MCMAFKQVYFTNMYFTFVMVAQNKTSLNLRLIAEKTFCVSDIGAHKTAVTTVFSI